MTAIFAAQFQAFLEGQRVISDSTNRTYVPGNCV